MQQKTIKNTYLVNMPDINSPFFKSMCKRIPYNYLPVNCIEPIYSYMCDSISMILNSLASIDIPYIIMSSKVKMIVETKNQSNNTRKPENILHEFPDPGISEMVCLYPELSEIMGNKLSRTVIEYCNQETQKPLLYLFPSNTLQPPVGCNEKLCKSLELIDDDACIDLDKEIKIRRKYMIQYYNNHDM